MMKTLLKFLIPIITISLFSCKNDIEINRQDNAEKLEINLPEFVLKQMSILTKLKNFQSKK